MKGTQNELNREEIKLLPHALSKGERERKMLRLISEMLSPNSILYQKKHG